MRRTRWLFLAAIVAIIFTVGAAYIKRREILDKEVPVHPKPLETGVEGRAPDWEHTEFKGDKKHFTVRARNFRQIKDPSVVELEGVELQLYRDDGQKSDLIHSESAQLWLWQRSCAVLLAALGQGPGPPGKGQVVRPSAPGKAPK